MERVPSYSGLDPSRFVTVNTAREMGWIYPEVPLYNLENAPALAKNLVENGVGELALRGVTSNDFESLTALFEQAIEDCPGPLQGTIHTVDSRFGNEAGYRRKTRKFDDKGQQSEDPKHYFHFNEHANRFWESQSAGAPRSLKEFLRAGQEVQGVLTKLAKAALQELTVIYPNIDKLYFGKPESQTESQTFMRVLSYDSYMSDGSMSPVGKEHRDISSWTIQAYSDAPGFWGKKHGFGEAQEKVYYPSLNGSGQLFAGASHTKIYGNLTQVQPLVHGVDRQAYPEGTEVARRHAVILFVNAPLIDTQVTAADTVPYLER